VYGQSATWGNPGRSANLAERLVRTFFYSAPAHMFFRSNTDLRSITDIFYLMMVPWFVLHARNVESFRREGDRTILGLEGNAVVDLDWAKQGYSITLDGVEVARDASTFCPFGNDRIAFYSTEARELVAALPPGWSGSSMAGFALSSDGATEAPVSVDGGTVGVAVAAQKPVLVYRNGERARRRLLHS